ncbi:hypothetical protein BOTCAL_0167g00130 [Botryotinia calthae]|uniref:Uncharacterized protein n=1 Tax=Botryotinia calthae TaxID=38488 RepID=A0A4Y8D1B2_9HELO|nr:hypothetical protein BOTCAL_0167g00130 [Botryotinia calthae]
MTDSESQILKSPSWVSSRPSTPGASFLHTASLSCPTKYFSETREATKSLAPNASASSPPSPVKMRKLGGPERALRFKTSLTLSLPDEETFGQPSIDLPGLDIARNFAFGLGLGSRTSRIEKRRSVAFVEETREDGKNIFKDVNLDAHKRRIGDKGLEPVPIGDEAEEAKQRSITEILDRREDDDEGKCNIFFGRFRKAWGYLTVKSSCF